MVELVTSFIIEVDYGRILEGAINGTIEKTHLQKLKDTVVPGRDLGESCPENYKIVEAILNFINFDGPKIFSLSEAELVNTSFNIFIRHPITGETIFHKHPNLLQRLYNNKQITFKDYMTLATTFDFGNYQLVKNDYKVEKFDDNLNAGLEWSV